MKKSEKISKHAKRTAKIALEHKLGTQRPSLKELKKSNLIHSDHQAHHAPAIAKKMKTLQRKFPRGRSASKNSQASYS